MKADEIGEKLKEVRKSRKMTVTDAAIKSGYSYQHIFAMEEYNRKISLVSLCDILEAYGYELEFRRK